MTPPTGKHEPITYFLRESHEGQIKIGTTTNYDARLRQLATPTTAHLELIHWEWGGKDHERRLHDKFARHRVRRDREWFRPAPALLDYIASTEPGHAGRLGLVIPAIPWDRLAPRRRRRRSRRRSFGRGYTSRTLGGIARRLAITAAVTAGLYATGHQIAPAETDRIVTLIQSWL